MTKRIVGIDVARSLAVFGMIIVNFKIVFGTQTESWLTSLAGIFDGKAAATFVVLAGVGLALMSKSAIIHDDRQKLKKTKTRIVKRALFLFVIGLSYIVIWPADILHFYGIYMLLTLFFLNSSKRIILLSAVFFIFIYPILMLCWNYETGWDFNTLEYYGFWTFAGFFRNLFYNGFHPVIPWTALMLIGLWFGKFDLHNEKFIKKTFWISLLVFIAVQFLSKAFILLLSEGNQQTAAELSEIIGTSPMPPLPIYMINGSSIALCIIAACIYLARQFENTKVVTALTKTGQLAFTFYVLHVILGMGIIEIIYPDRLGTFSTEFSVIYAIIFCLFCIAFALLWYRYKKIGPLEWLMRKMTN